MKQIIFFVVACSIFFSCSITSQEEKFELIQNVDSVFTLKNYYPEDEDNPNPGYVDISLSMKVYESNQTKVLSPDSIPFLKKDVELRKKKVEIIIDNWLNEPFIDTIDANYLVDEFRLYLNDGNDILLKNAEILDLPQIILNRDYNFVIDFVIGIPETDKRYRCRYTFDVMGYGIVGFKIED